MTNLLLNKLSKKKKSNILHAFSDWLVPLFLFFFLIYYEIQLICTLKEYAEKH